jgi:hypothetical protein
MSSENTSSLARPKQPIEVSEQDGLHLQTIVGRPISTGT